MKDGTLNLDVSIVSNGQEKKLERRAIPVKTFATARESVPFSGDEGISPWIQHYHSQPSPALSTLPAIRITAADKKARAMLNLMQFMVTALKENPPAAEELRTMRTVAGTKLYGTYVLGQAGYSVDDLLPGLDEASISALKTSLPDPYDLTPNQMLFQKQDMLWAIFFASGRREGGEALASMLAWGKDYEAFEEVRKAHEKDPSKKAELNETLVRGLAYMAAGWSLSAISRDDALVTDYLLTLQESPTFPQAAKTELKTLHTNPVFKHGPGGQ